VLELRVEDHPDPLAELRRLITVHRAYERMNAGDLAVEKGDLDLAKAEYTAAAALLPGSLEVQYWAAVTLATAGELEAALPAFRTVFAADPNWVELTRRLIKPGIIPDTPEGHALVERIAAAAARPTLPPGGRAEK
jgi:tetratricopeptide (TPR) repeat protein